MASGGMIPMLIEDTRPAVKAGGEVLRANPDVFPERRACRDVIWGVLFVAVAVAVAVVSWVETDGFHFVASSASQPGAQKVQLKGVAAALVVSGLASCLLAFVFVWLTRNYATLVIWVALLAAPVAMLLVAIAMPLLVDDLEAALVGSACLAVPALLMLTCAICCWARMIPFTAEVLEAVTTVLLRHCSLVFVALGGLVASMCWTLLCAIAVVGVYDRMLRSRQKGDEDDGKGYVVYFAVALLFAWGSLICQNVCHVTYAGVFGRWYFSLRESVGSSLRVALTTSFGSICLGSLIVAAIQAFEAMLRQMRNTARQERNMVMVICLCVLECVVACVREIAEAVSYIAYIQVAIRGLGFIPSVKATFALCTFGNTFALVRLVLVGNVVCLGSLLCGVSAGALGYAAGLAFHPAGTSGADVAAMDMVNLVFGMIVGIVAAATVLGVLRSGFATVLVCWAEEKDLLVAHDARLHEMFMQRTDLSRQG